MLLKNRKCIILWTNGAKTTLLQVSLCVDTCNQFITLSFGFFIGKKGKESSPWPILKACRAQLNEVRKSRRVCIGGGGRQQGNLNVLLFYYS